MANLKVNFAGVEFKNPLVLASATPGWDGERLKQGGLAGFGGVIPKTIGPVQDWAAHPRNGRMALVRVGNKPIGMVNMELFTTKSREDWIKEDLAKAKEGGATMFVSVLAMPEPEETAALIEQVQDTGMVDLFELNVSCPMPAGTVGMHIGKSPELTYQQVKAAKSVAKRPLSVKLTPVVADMVPIAQAAEEAGVDAISISNSVRSFAGVNIDTGKPILRAYGGYSGPAIRPIVMRHLSEVARAVKVPLSAIGGVSSWRDVIEYMMLGATTVQMATTIMWNGYAKVQEILKGLETFMDEKGYQSFDEIIGCALPYITTTEALAKEPALQAYIDEDKCNNCGICHPKCFYDAIHWDGDRTWTNPENCDGCGLCVVWCPKEAIALK